MLKKLETLTRHGLHTELTASISENAFSKLATAEDMEDAGASFPEAFRVLSGLRVARVNFKTCSNLSCSP